MQENPAVSSVQRLIRQGKFRKAIPELERALAAEPSDARLRFALADVLTRTDAPEQAVEQLCQVARRYERDGSGTKAMAVYMQVLRLDPGHREAAIALARNHVEYGQYEAAAAAFEGVLRASRDPVARLGLIQVLLDLDADNIADRVRLAEAYASSGQLQDAARELRRVADALDGTANDAVWAMVAERFLYFQPDDLPVVKRLASFYLSEGAPQLALPRLRKAFEARPRDLEVLSLLVDTFSQLGQIQKSVAVLKEMIRLYDQSGLVHEKRDCWRRVLVFDPTDRDAQEALESSGHDIAGQTIDLPLGDLGHPPRPSARPQPADYEPGFGDESESENTIIDDVFMPDLLRASAMDGRGMVLGEAAPAPLQGADDELQELDFFIQTGLRAEAEAALAELRARFGPHPDLASRERRLAEGR